MPVISVEPIRASDLVDLAVSDWQDLDCGELVKLVGEAQLSAPLGLLHLSVLSLEVALFPHEEPWLVHL